MTIIKCPKCGAGYKVSDEKLKAVVTRIRCAKCKHTFVFVKDQFDDIADESIFAEGCIVATEPEPRDGKPTGKPRSGVYDHHFYSKPLSHIGQSPKPDSKILIFRCPNCGCECRLTDCMLGSGQSQIRCPNCNHGFVPCQWCHYGNSLTAQNCQRCGCRLVSDPPTTVHSEYSNRNKLAEPEPSDPTKRIICPYCQKKGYVAIRSDWRNKGGLSGIKLLLGYLTGGISLVGTGISKEECVQVALCQNCNATWTMPWKHKAEI